MPVSFKIFKKFEVSSILLNVLLQIISVFIILHGLLFMLSILGNVSKVFLCLILCAELILSL